MKAALLVTTLGGIGRLKPAPGTWGSLAVLPCALLGPDVALVLAFLVTRNRRWLRFAYQVLRLSIVTGLVLVLLYALERLL